MLSKALLFVAFLTTATVAVTDWLGYTEVIPKIVCIRTGCGPR